MMQAFEPTITLGNILTIAGFVVGIVLAWSKLSTTVTLGFKAIRENINNVQKESHDDIQETSRRLDTISVEMGKFRDEYVKEKDQDRTLRDIDRRLAAVEVEQKQRRER